MSKRLFITGGTGYLGGALLRLAAGRGYTLGASYLSQQPPGVPGIAWARLDIRDPQAVHEVLQSFRPDVVIHTAFVQYEPDLMAITAEGSGHVAQAAAELGARLIHMSSDVIFDGERAEPYTEAEPPAPISAYGEAKAAAERLVAAAYPGAAIIRTSLIYGFEPLDRQTRFALEIADGQRGDRLFSDEYRCPIFVDDLAAALLELAEIDYAGVLHVAGAERVSRYEMGTLLARALGYDPARIQAGRSADLPVRRPRNCALNIGRASALLHTRLRGLRELLKDRAQIEGNLA
ncbi:SDR family oxidoreductase [Chloroflexales bacterium ZM16-3]|nr:SDR family oxidoreductase [Chloroflexales bacterium ZM16-3]